MELLKKIQAVASEVMSIDKDMTVGNNKYGYKAVSDFNVTKKVKEAEQKYGVVSIPTRQELVHHEIVKTVTDKGERINFSFLIKMTVKIYDVENPQDFIEVETFGHGLDSGDKGFGKASTYARKYALLNAYKIATGEDPDAEKSKEQEGQLSPSEKKVAVLNYLTTRVDAAQRIMKHFNVGHLDELSDDMYDKIFKSYKKKGLI